MSDFKKNFVKFIDESPDANLFPNQSPKTLSFLSQEEMTEVEEEKALILEENQITQMFQRFTKSQSVEKFKNFVFWVESKKPFSTRKIYEDIKNFKFLSHFDFEGILKENEGVNCLGISPNNHYLAVGSERSAIHLWDLTQKKPLGYLGIAEKVDKINCLVLTNESLFSAGWDKIIRKWDLIALGQTKIYEGHEGPILCMAITPDNGFLVSGGEDQTMIVWDLNSDTMRKIIAHKSPISAIEISRLGDKIISASWDMTIKIWKFSNFHLEGILKGHSDFIRTLALSPDGNILASSGRDRIIKIWDLITQKEKNSFEDSLTVLSLKFSEYGDFLISAGNDKTIKFWNMRKNKLKKRIEAHSDIITSLAMMSDGHTFVSGSFDKTLKVWILEKDTEMYLSINYEILALAVFPDNIRAVSSGTDNMLRVWNLSTGEQIVSIYEEKALITALAISYDGKHFCSGDSEGFLAIWDSKTYFKVLGKKIHLNGGVISIKFYPFTNKIVTIGQDNSIKISTDSLETSMDSKNMHPGSITALEISFNGGFIITASKEDYSIYFWEFLTLKYVRKLEGHQAEIRALKTAVHSFKLISGGFDGTIKIWDLKTHALEQSIETSFQIFCLELTNDEFTIISTHEDATLRLWDFESGELIGRTQNYAKPFKVIALTPDSSMILSALNGLKKLFLNKIKSKSIVNQHQKSIRSLVLSPDNTLLAAGSDDFTISIWDTDFMKLRKVIEAHTKAITSLLFTSNSKILISGSEDHWIKAWEMPDGKEAYAINECEDVIGIALYQNGEKLMAVCGDNSLRVFDLNQRKLLNCSFFENLLCKIIVNNSGNKAYSGDDAGTLYEFELENMRITKKFDGQLLLALAVSFDDLKLFSSFSNGEIKIWNLQTDNFELLKTFDNNGYLIHSLVVNSKNTKLFSASDQRILIWDLINYKKIAEFEDHSAIVRCLALSSNEETLWSCSDDGCIRAWNLKDCREMAFLKGHQDKILRMAISPNGQYLVSGDENDKIIVWDLLNKNNKIKHVLSNGEGCKIQGLAITSDGNKIIASTNKLKKTIWDLKEGKKLAQFEFPAYSQRLILSPDDKNAIIGYSDSIIRSWNLEKLKIEKSFQGHNGFIRDLILTNNGRKLISGSEDHLIIIWDIETEKNLKTLNGHDDEVTALALNHDNTMLFSGGKDAKVIIWDFFTFQIRKSFDGLPNPISDLKISQDNQKLFASCSPGDFTEENKGKKVYVWSLKNYELLPLLNNLTYNCDSLVLSSDLKTIATCEQKTIYLWNYSDCSEKYVLPGFKSIITAETMTPNKQMIILADGDNKITVWDLKLRKKIVHFEGHSDFIKCLIATSKNRVISASDDKTIGIWSIDEGKLLDKLQSHLAPINAIAMSKDEDILLSTSAGGCILLWDLNTRKQLKKFYSPESIINALFIFPDKKKFMSAGSLGIIKIWDLEDEYEIPKIVAISSMDISQILLSPNLKIMLVFSLNSGKIQIWNIQNYTLINELDYKNTTSLPIFLSNHNNRLILCFDKLIDCLTGRVLFYFSPREEILSYFYDYKSNNYFFISTSFRLYQFSQDWLATYLYNSLIFDSILFLKKDASEICQRTMSTFPYFFSFLHLISIYDKSEYFTIEKMREIYTDKTNLMSVFCSLDIFLNTPLDILIQRKNTTLIMKYFKMLFEVMADETSTFYDKTRFFQYNFKENYSFLSLLCDLIPLIGDDLTSLSEIFDNSLIDFDGSVYDNSLVMKELDEPLLIEIDGIYANKEFIEKKLNEILKKNEKIEKKSVEIEESKSIMKAKIFCIPCIYDLNFEKTKVFYSLIANFDSSNKIYTNETLAMLVNFIWTNQTSFYYTIEFLVFLFFFVLFNINFVFLMDFAASSKFLPALIIDFLLLIYSIFNFANEIGQLYQHRANYFQSIWNYFDIALIPLLMSSTILDFSSFFYEFGDMTSYLKLLFSMCMCIFCFRMLSFSRGIKETSSMIRLIFTVISGVKHFVFFMILFMLTLSSSFFLLKTDSTSFWDTFLIFYQTAVGDSSGISSYNIIFPDLVECFVILATFLFAIISVNLLVSIIGDKHSDLKENEEKTRIYELLKIIVDTDSSLVTQITKKIAGIRKNGKFLLKVYNDKHENNDENQKKYQLEMKIEKFQKTISEENQNLEEKIQKGIKENNENIMRIEEKINTICNENGNYRNEIEKYFKEMRDYMEIKVEKRPEEFKFKF